MTGKLVSLIVAALLLTALTARAQFDIHGTVTNQEGQPLNNAQVLLQLQESRALLKTGFTDSTGAYRLDANTLYNTNIVVSAAGFASQSRLLTDTTTKNQQLDFVLLPASNSLEGVTVSSKKPLFEKKVDRLIFNVANSITAAGGTALEAIGKAPGVLVNRQYNTINLAGKGSVNVLLNGKLLQLSGEDLFAYLEGIPAENVQQVEIITAPPSQYEAAGTSGLINVVLKKNRKVGLSGLANAGYQQAFYGTATAGGAINYHKNKLSTYTNLNLSSGAKNQVERLNTNFPEQEYRLTDPYQKSVQNGQLSAGADYQLHASGTLSLNYTGSKYQRQDRVANYTAVIQRSTGLVDSTLFTSGTSEQEQHTHLLNLGYDWAIDTSGKKLSITANRLWYGSNRNRPTSSENFYGLFQAPTGFLVANKATSQNRIDITTAQADVTLPYPWTRLSLGGKISHISQSSENRFYTRNSGVYVEDPGVSNAFDYTENVGALYVNAQKDLGKFSLQAGLRMEATETKGISQALTQANTHSYLNFFPTLMASYQPKENSVWALTYSRRILRPGYSDLDPFRLYFSPTSYAEGNPFLQPAFSHEASLAYTLNGKYTFQGYYQYEENHFGLVFGADSTTQSTYIRHENYSDNQAAGLGIVAAFQPFHFWELQAQLFGNLNQVRPYEQFGDGRNLTLPSYFISANNAISLNKKGTLLTEVNAYLVGRYQWEVSEVEPTGSVDTGFKALLLDKRLVLSVSATDLFRTTGGRSRNLITGQTMSSYFDQQSLRLAVNFKMGGKSNREAQQKETGIEAEQSRM